MLLANDREMMIDNREWIDGHQILMMERQCVDLHPQLLLGQGMFAEEAWTHLILLLHPHRHRLAIDDESLGTGRTSRIKGQYIFASIDDELATSGL